MSRKPRIGFVGIGWIGRSRLEAMLATGAIEAAAICDASEDALAAASALAPGAQVFADYDAMLALDLDGVVVATPSAGHAGQAVAALERGFAVFCQKPLGRDETEVRAVVDAARRADRLLGVDLSYRFTDAMVRIRDLVRSGELGRVFAADLVFHNAYGPDKPWFYDRAQSGGGCVVDLGIHLIDLALWTLDYPEVAAVSARLYAGGTLLPARSERIEDYALASIVLETGASLRLACSWRAQAGRDAVIGAEFHGTGGGTALRNVDGSFYDFTAERFRGTAREPLCGPPDAWGSRAAADWARRLAGGERFDAAEGERLVSVASVLDSIYGRRAEPVHV